MEVFFVIITKVSTQQKMFQGTLPLKKNYMLFLTHYIFLMESIERQDSRNYVMRPL